MNCLKLLDWRTSAVPAGELGYTVRWRRVSEETAKETAELIAKKPPTQLRSKDGSEDSTSLRPETGNVESITVAGPSGGSVTAIEPKRPNTSTCAAQMA